ncbi:MAG TPA: GAF and ANTAR domain-containing protein [Actinomycetes bacterium]|jgi:GAF domain-containing protein|nr:GAF and ANTAR domain-containing protein [Actinomycetes bacterium]
MPIDPDVLARSVTRLEGVDPVDTGLDAALELAVSETDDVFAVDGAGLLLLSEDGVLRYTAASDEPGRMLETLQEQFGEGPCVDAFLEDGPVLAGDMDADPRWPSVGPLAARHGVRAVLGVPIDLRDGPVGTLNVYAARPHHWDQGDVAGIQAYARVIASLLRSAVQAHLKGRAASQLQHALDHRSLIEQAKGILMERRGLDQQAAFDLLRSRARSTRRRLDDLAREVVEGAQLPG